MGFLEEIYKQMYPDQFSGKGIVSPILGQTLTEVRLRPVNSNIEPNDVNLHASVGPIDLKLPLLSAAMDQVSGVGMAKVLAEVGGCGIIYRHKKADVQLQWIKEALSHQPCLVANPKTLSPDSSLQDAKDILDEYGFSTIPVVGDDKLCGILFTRDVAWQGHLDERVDRWMMTLTNLKRAHPDSSFDKIKQQLLGEKCSVLPIVSSNNSFHGIYFKKDFYNANPAWHNGKIAVGMAIGVSEYDLERVEAGLEMGVAIIVIDSSHGDCDAVIDQAKSVVELVSGRAAVIAGNVADPGGYYRLANVGVDGVKCGIGSGSICTTSQVTGAAFPMFTLIRELRFIRQKMHEAGKSTPVIVPDGGINGPGDMVLALAAGGHICMAGKWLVSAQESLSCENRVPADGLVYYRGMASKPAIDARSADRYDKGKKAPEGVEGKVPFRGPLKKWIGEDMELVRGGFAHVGLKDILSLHKHCDWPLAFVRFSGVGQEQNNTRVMPL